MPRVQPEATSESDPDFSAQPYPGGSLRDLHPRAVERFRQLWLERSTDTALARLPAAEVLEAADLVAQGLPTVAALVLLGTERALTRFLRRAEIIFELRSDKGEVVRRVEYRQGNLLVLDELWRAIDLSNNLISYQGHLVREQVPTFNEATVREAILNAVIHRDYRLSEPISIRQWPTKIEISSPGGIPAGACPERFLQRRVPRNPRIAQTLERCGLVEYSGRGAQRMFASSIREGKPPPDFVLGENRVVIVLDGSVRDPELIRFLERAETEMAGLETEHLLVLDAIHRGVPIPGGEELSEQRTRLCELGILEPAEGKLVLSSRFYDIAHSTQRQTFRGALVAADLVAGSEPMSADGSDLLLRHNGIIRSLLEEHDVQEIDDKGGHLMFFHSPCDAILFALRYHDALEELRAEGFEAAARVGIHVGKVAIHRSAPPRVAAEARRLVGRLRSLAQARQTLLTRRAFAAASTGHDVAYGEKLCWLAHGAYLFRNAARALDIFEVGREELAPLQAPADSQAAVRVHEHTTIPGWRPARGLEIPHRADWVVERKEEKGTYGEAWLGTHRVTHDRRVFKFCFCSTDLPALQREVALSHFLERELGERGDIAGIADSSLEEAPYFVAFEYSPAVTLPVWADQQGGIGAVPLAERLQVVAQMATALAAAHSVGVIHTDVRPANILVGRDPVSGLRARLAGFGVGTVTDSGRLLAAGILGHPLAKPPASRPGAQLYTAPELLEGHAPTIQSDVFALGVVLFQLIAGDFSSAPAPGWERDVPDELLREDIAAAVEGSPKRRLEDARQLAERLCTLEKRRRIALRPKLRLLKSWKLPLAGLSRALLPSR